MSEEIVTAATEPAENITPAAGTEPAAFLFENADPAGFGEDNVNFLKDNNLTSMTDLVALAAKGKTGISLPDDTPESLLAFRQACGYPENSDGYGLETDTEEKKEIVDFLHRCHLDKWAAKAVYNEVLANIQSTDKEAKEKYDADYAKHIDAWGDNKQANLNLLQRGLEAFKLTPDQLRAMSDTVGVEAALGLMLALGRVHSDHSGVSGGSGGGSHEESLESFILSRRGA